MNKQDARCDDGR